MIKVNEDTDWEKVKKDREYYTDPSIKQGFEDLQHTYDIHENFLTEEEKKRHTDYLMWYCYSPKFTPDEIFEGIKCNQVWEFNGEYHVVDSYDMTPKEDGTFNSLVTIVYNKSTGKDRTCAFHPMTLEWMPTLKECGKLVGEIGVDFCILSCGCEYLINIKDWDETISSYVTRKGF